MRSLTLLGLVCLFMASCKAQHETSRQESAERREIKAARIVGEPIFLPHFGDLWMSTWADDGHLYVTWGDGTGLGEYFPSLGVPEGETVEVPPPPSDPDEDIFHFIFTQTFDVVGQRLPTARLTDTGLLCLRGPVPHFVLPADPREAIVVRNIPTGNEWFDDSGARMADRNDKPSSLLCVGGRLYLAGHSPAGHVELGWLAYSDDHGRTWTEVPDSPWGPESVFRVLMFINMGRDYELNRDGYVYALGIGSEAGWTTDPAKDGRPEYEDGTVYLARVGRNAAADYSRYEYYAGTGPADSPNWSPVEADARPLDGLKSYMTASSMYHPGTGNYLFLTAAPGSLFVAPKPWGPWRKVASLFQEGDNPNWRAGGYIPGLITKGAGESHVYFPLAGPEDRYRLHIGRIELVLK